MVKILPSNAGGVGLIPDWGAEIPYALWPKKITQNKSRSNFVTNSIKDFKNDPYEKKIFKKKKLGLNPECTRNLQDRLPIF